MTQKKIACMWKFSSSRGDKSYETLLYIDGSTSCDCPGWTRRAERSCKHTRSVHAGTADAESTTVVRYVTNAQEVAKAFMKNMTPAPIIAAAAQMIKSGKGPSKKKVSFSPQTTTLRKLRFDDED